MTESYPKVNTECIFHHEQITNYHRKKLIEQILPFDQSIQIKFSNPKNNP